jgi:hypothetical protein
MTYYLVLDTITDRVIAYSEDTLQPLGSNTYLGQTSALPTGISDANCWEYRFRGGSLKHAPHIETPPATSAAAVLREAKYELRKTVIDRAQQAFHRKVPLTALAYIGTLDAARKWLAGQPLDEFDLGFVPSREEAQQFVETHQGNLRRALELYGPMVRKLDAIDAAKDASELEKIVP